MLGEHLNMICRPVSRRLVISQRDSVKRYNRIVKEHCSIHRIQERLDAIDKMTKYRGYPSPKWLEKMIDDTHTIRPNDRDTQICREEV